MKTPNLERPFPLSNRKARSMPYMRKRPYTHQAGNMPFKVSGQEFENLERLQAALGTHNRQDTIRQCLNLVYASLVKRDKIEGYPQLGVDTDTDK